MDRLRDAFASLRRRRPFVDHLVRTGGRYQADTGDRLAAAVTFYWFLSLFPILLLAVALLGYVYGDRAGEQLRSVLGGVLPEPLVATLSDTVTSARAPAGVLGILGTLSSGLGWIDGLREAIRTVWHQNVLAGNVVVRKLKDVLVLVGLFGTIGASVVVTGIVTGYATALLDLVGVQDSLPARVLARLLGYALGLLADTALFLYLFSRLSRVTNPLRRLLAGAVFGAVGFELLKVVGGYYVSRTTTKGEATYGTFAVVVGLLLFLNLVSRVVLLAAAFVVTAPYDSDVAPSGTSSPQLADRADIPVEYADADPDDPPAVQDDGAPSPLLAAVQGRTAPQDEPTGAPGRDAVAVAVMPGRRPTADGAPVGRHAAGAGVPTSSSRLPEPRRVRTAARVTAAAGGLALGAVGLHAVGTLRRLARRR